MRRILQMACLMLGLLAPVAAQAGKGARVIVENQVGGALDYELADASGLSSDSALRKGARGTVAAGARTDIGYLEATNWLVDTIVHIRLRDPAGNTGTIRLFEGDGRWSARPLDPASTGRLVNTLIEVRPGDQDTIVVRAMPAFSLQTWIGELAARDPRWLTRPVSAFAMLGTHDSTTYNYERRLLHPQDLYVRTQEQSIADQLASGVRFLDYRLGWKNGQVEMYHGSYSLYLSFADAIGQVNRFLDDHPDEFVLLSVKIDSGKDEDISRWLNDPARAPLLRKLYRASTIPTYAAAKGRIVVLNRGVGALQGIAIDVPDNAKAHLTGANNAVQDAYDQTKLSRVEKGVLIRAFYDTCMRDGAGHDGRCDGKFRINFVSGVNLKPPYAYAAVYNPILLDPGYATTRWSGIFVIDSDDDTQMRQIARNLVLGNYD